MRHLKIMKEYKKEIEKIKNLESFDELYELAKNKNYLKFINPFALETLNLKKIKNFLVASIERKTM